MKPLALLDVDGVIARECASRKAAKRAGYRTYSVEGPNLVRYPLHMDPNDTARIRRLMAHFDLGWATTWESAASINIARILGLPQGLPYATWKPSDGYVTGWDGELYNKVPGVLRLVQDRPFVWFDDNADAFAPHLTSPDHHLIACDPNVGLTDELIDTAIRRTTQA